MWRRTGMIAWKEFIQIYRDWRTLGVVVILPVLMLTLYGYAINFDIKHLPLGVLDRDRTRESRDMINAFARGVYFDIATWLDDPRQIDDALDRGTVKAVLVIPRGFSSDLAAGRAGQVQLLVDGADSTTATTAIGYLNAIIGEHSLAVTVEAVRRRGITVTENFLPVESRPRFWYNPDQKSTNYIVPGLIVIIMMMMSSLLTAMTVVRERERGTMEQLIVSPIHPLELLLGKLVPYVVIAFTDVILVIGAGRVLFSVSIVGNKALLLALSGVFLMAALGIGLLISVLSPTQQTAMTFAMLVSQLPSVLLSGFMFPISAMPAPVQWLTNIIPARHFLVIVRAIFLKGVGLAVLWRPVLILLVFGLIALGIGSMKFKKKL